MNIVLTDEEKTRFSQFVIENISADTIPNDEGNQEALIFNIVHAIRGDNEQYDYKDHQDEEVRSWGVDV